MRKLIGISALFIALANFATAQIKFVGETKAKVGELIRLKVPDVKGNDLKIVCVPANDDWEATRNLDNQIVIFLFPKKPGTYTIVLAANESNKTLLGTTSVEFVDAAPQPLPTPIPTDPLYKSLKAAYLVSPDADAATKLIGVYEGMVASQKRSPFATMQDAWTVLQNTTKAELNSDSILRSVRDEVANYLQKNVGTSGPLDGDKFIKAFTAVAETLKAVKNGN